MNAPGHHALNLSTENLVLLVVGMIIYVALVLFLLNGYGINLVLIIGFALALWIANRYPLLTVMALLFTRVIPTVFQMAPFFNEDYGAIGGGFNAVDIVLLAMGGASVARLWKSRSGKRNTLGLYHYALLFALWLGFEVVRNITIYGISAPGEFRYRYLILVMPLYVGLFFSTHQDRRKLFRLLVFSCLVIALVCVPIIWASKTWSLSAFGTQETRLLPSHITLGFVYALAMLFLADRYEYVKVKSAVLWATAIPVLFMVLIDSHRSVWLVSTVILLSLMWLKQIRFARIWYWGIPLVLVVAVVWYAASATGLSVLDYIAARGVAFVNPEEDQTSAWRLAQWETQITKFYNSPIAGEGFGGYFGLTGLRGDVGVSPHSLYVQTLVKLGGIGLFLYLMVVFKLFSAFRRWIRDKGASQNPEIALVLTAFVVLIGAHAYYSVYAFDYYTWLFVGLGTAVIRSTPHGDGDGQ